MVFIGLKFKDFVDLHRFSVSFDHLVRHNHRRRKCDLGEDDECEQKNNLSMAPKFISSEKWVLRGSLTTTLLLLTSSIF